MKLGACQQAMRQRLSTGVHHLGTNMMQRAWDVTQAINRLLKDNVAGHKFLIRYR